MENNMSKIKTPEEWAEEKYPYSWIYYPPSRNTVAEWLKEYHEYASKLEREQKIEELEEEAAFITDDDSTEDKYWRSGVRLAIEILKK